MRFRIALAFSVSVLLIGSAFWFRYEEIKESKQDTLVSVGSLNVDYSGGELRNFVETSAAIQIYPEPISNPDTIGKQLILEYLNLAYKGEVTEENIEVLANKYVSGLPKLSSAGTISQSDLKDVADTKTNFQKYADEITRIHKEYSEAIKKVSASTGNPTALSPELYSITSDFSKAYANTIPKLKAMAVPNSLINLHVELINTYLSSTASAAAISQSEVNSAGGFIGLINLQNNMEKENDIRAKITGILTLNGI